MNESEKRKKPSGRKGHVVLVLLLTIAALLAAVLVYLAVRRGTGVPSIGTGIVQTRATTQNEPTEPPETIPPETEPPTQQPTEPELSDEKIAAQTLLETMTLEEKVWQLIVTTPDALANVYGADMAGDMTRAALEQYPVGGVVYFGQNIISETQIREMIAGTQSFSRIPLLIGVDEEGGRVSRLSGVGATTAFDPMAVYGAAGDENAVREIGRTLAGELSSAGFNLNFAPVADVVTNPNNTEIGDRSFSDDPAVAAEMVAAMVEGLQESGTISCLKHFPGHGSTEADSHEGRSVTERTLEELRGTELVSFAAGIDAGAEMVMISHMSAPNVTGGDMPCDLSAAVVTELLRGELGFTGVVITDSHEMGAITQYYTPGEAAVLALQAGCDIVLMPNDLEGAVQTILDAVEDGALTEERIEESVLRILTLKYRYEIITE